MRILVDLLFFFFFFKQKTAYEMRISDWSSDVCSSDLKVPVTVLSRCQRFDLRRITPDMLFAHFSAILQKEGVEAEAPAIWLIAGAAEGSVRDGLSILDQAIAHADLESGDGGSARIGADQVRAMPGLSDRSEEHTSEPQSLMTSSYAVFCFKKQ